MFLPAGHLWARWERGTVEALREDALSDPHDAGEKRHRG